MADFRFGHVLSDETEDLLKGLAERLQMTDDEILEEAVRMYAATATDSAEDEAAEMTMDRISAAIALDASPAVVVQLAEAGRIRMVVTEHGDRYSRQDIEREAETLRRDRERSGYE